MNTNKVQTRSRKKLYLSVLAGIITFSCTSLAYAQDDEAYFDGVLEEVIVTATKRAESIQDVPLSIATLSGEQLQAMFSGGEDVLALSSIL